VGWGLRFLVFFGGHFFINLFSHEDSGFRMCSAIEADSVLKSVRLKLQQVETSNELILSSLTESVGRLNESLAHIERRSNFLVETLTDIDSHCDTFLIPDDVPRFVRLAFSLSLLTKKPDTVGSTLRSLYSDVKTALDRGAVAAAYDIALASRDDRVFSALLHMKGNFCMGLKHTDFSPVKTDMSVVGKIHLLESSAQQQVLLTLSRFLAAQHFVPLCLFEIEEALWNGAEVGFISKRDHSSQPFRCADRFACASAPSGRTQDSCHHPSQRFGLY
jgi:hypothetical protein